MNAGIQNKFIYWYKKHGILNLGYLLFQRVWRRLVSNAQVIFYFDCTDPHNNFQNAQVQVSLEHYENQHAISPRSLNLLYNSKSGVIIDDMLERFFQRGATLWLASVGNQIVGFQWTKLGGFDGFYGIPMTPRDAVIMAVEILPEHRGKGMNPVIMQHTISMLKEAGASRVFIGSNVWNKPQLKSIPKAGFKRLGTVHIMKILGRYITVWNIKELSVTKGSH